MLLYKKQKAFYTQFVRNRKFRATYLFRVAKGFPAKVTLSQRREARPPCSRRSEHGRHRHPEQHLRLMQPGTLGY